MNSRGRRTQERQLINRARKTQRQLAEKARREKRHQEKARESGR